jgi:DNA-binding transcriptional regulator LsrR (DeoR family)
MEGAETIPDNVLRFIADRIESVPHLEALLLLWQNQDRGWTRDEIATRVYVSGDTAEQLLQDLARQGMVKTDPYRYATDWQEGIDLMPQLAATYSRQLVRVAQLIHSKASLGVREFARAFQLKKDRS